MVLIQSGHSVGYPSGNMLQAGYARQELFAGNARGLPKGVAPNTLTNLEFSGRFNGFAQQCVQGLKQAGGRVALPVLAAFSLNQAAAQTGTNTAPVAGKTMPQLEVDYAHKGFFNYLANTFPKNKTRLCYEIGEKNQKGEDSLQVWKFEVLDSTGKSQYSGRWVWEKKSPQNENYMIMAKDSSGNVIGAKNQLNPFQSSKAEANDGWVYFFNNSLQSEAPLDRVDEVSSTVLGTKVDKALPEQREREKEKRIYKRISNPGGFLSDPPNQPLNGTRKSGHNNQRVQGGRLYKRA